MFFTHVLIRPKAEHPCSAPLHLSIPRHPSAQFSITSGQWWIEDILGRPASVRLASCVPVWVNRGSLISARGLRGGSRVRVWSSLSWQPCSPLLLFVNRCVCLNGSLSVELLHEPMGPEHLSPPRSVLINDSFSAVWGGGGGGGGKEDDEAGWEIRSERTDCTTVHSMSTGTLQSGWLNFKLHGSNESAQYKTTPSAFFEILGWEHWDQPHTCVLKRYLA